MAGKCCGIENAMSELTPIQAHLSTLIALHADACHKVYRTRLVDIADMLMVRGLTDDVRGLLLAEARALIREARVTL